MREGWWEGWQWWGCMDEPACKLPCKPPAQHNTTPAGGAKAAVPPKPNAAMSPSSHFKHPNRRAYAIHHAGALINLTGDDNLLADVAPAAGRFMAGLPTGPRPAEPWNQTLPAESEAFLIPTQASRDTFDLCCMIASALKFSGAPLSLEGV